ncbi:branched-chain amino acid transport system II carrier protein [Facklamia miroungae]|uniref:Branched-chain amino acid transport system carrier protein n=1 Tax=Facklamia miroungae TaxID=120956 RepID=A0A1G7SUP5_9LACT|nr:branched-chain amino acid transport system II carrier protein [Facklamia miroungae]NKZ29528.1 branched-chain amino acid transport system II carrier protein [Facklamia miroungae]SDG26787.1 branched-chain amino acid:cation transporter, LIVCS family [Facklamia miroungae]
MKKKDLLAIGFMLFAMFFGAGNLIFPVALGHQAGKSLLPAIIGFIITGVGLPLLSMIVGSSLKGGYFQALKKINPAFATILLTSNYLIIGPLFAIPRTATTTYEMSVLPYITNGNGFALSLFTLVFFALVLWISLNKQSIVDSIGRWLTPILLLSLVIFLVRSYFLYRTNTPPKALMIEYQSHPLAEGFIKGYLTMDTLATLAFSIVVKSAFEAKGISDQKTLWKEGSKASLIAAGLLGVFYFGLAWVGNHIALVESLPQGQNLGTFLLQTIAHNAMGQSGVALLAIIVFLACLTTACGLVTAISQFFHDLYPKISYRNHVYLMTTVSWLIANQGLDRIIATSGPILNIIYPVTMSLIFLLILHRIQPLNKIQFLVPLLFVLLVSLLSVLVTNHVIEWGLIQQLPLIKTGFSWIPVLIVATVMSLLLMNRSQKLDFNV